jgi:Family of unknown function (DUF5335)
MTHRSELDRCVRQMSDAEAYTVLRFVQFLEHGHVRPRLDEPRTLLAQAEVIIDDMADIVESLEQPTVELVNAPRRVPALLEGAVEVPRAEWGTMLDGFSHVFHDLSCRLWVQPDDGEAHTLANDVPLGQVYYDAKGSERNSVQVALNRSGTVYSDFRFMHRVHEPRAIYLKPLAGGELEDLIVESAGRYTVLEVRLPDHPTPGLRGLAFLASRPEVISQ